MKDVKAACPCYSTRKVIIALHETARVSDGVPVRSNQLSFAMFSGKESHDAVKKEVEKAHKIKVTGSGRNSYSARADQRRIGSACETIQKRLYEAASKDA